MSWVLAFLGFAALIILHELGHFAAAKAVGMRVERFSLFFGPLLVKVRRGETEYGIGPIPLGGYVKISGMNPREELPPDVVSRAYYRQPVWKRVVVIAAGPLMNVLIAFAILSAILLVNGRPDSHYLRVDTRALTAPANAYLQPGDRIVSVDGARGDVSEIAQRISSHHCAGVPTNGCLATNPVRIVVDRDGRRLAFAITPRYDATAGIKRTRIGFGFATRPVGPIEAASLSVTSMWDVTRQTLTVFSKLFDAQQRKQLSGVVGGYKVTQQSIAASDGTVALYLLALISLSLAIINLLPFLPLDGGHIFWALAEKVRGRAISFELMERASIVGFALVLVIAAIGLSNDIGRLEHGGFKLR
jgi:regulator of sigma E protease